MNLLDILSTFVTHSLSVIVPFTIAGISVSFYMNEFRHQKFDFSVYLEEYVQAIQVILLGSTIFYITDHKLPNLMYEIYDSSVYILFSTIIYIILFDAFNFWLHRLMHTRFLYRHFHSVHHQYRPVMCISASAISLVDGLILGQTPIWLPVFLLYYFGHGIYRPAFYLLNVFITLWSFYIHSINDHKINRSILVDNCDHLKHHHLTRCNYGNMFKYWDVICGTYV